MTDVTTDIAAPAAEPQPQSFAEFEAAANATAKEPAEQDDSGEVEPPATDDGNGDDGENGTVNDEGDGDPAKPKGKPIQDRFNEMTNARREAERERDDARRDAEYWRAKATGGDKPAPEAEAANDDGRPDPTKFEYGEGDPEYIDARARWAAGQEFERLRVEADRDAKIAQLEQGWNERVAGAAEAYPDFDEKVLQAANRGEYELSQPLALGIKASPVGIDIAYHLATNPAEASRISRLPVTQQAYEFGKLEARMEAKAEARQPKDAPEPKPSKAPAPPANLARGAGGRFAPNPATDDFAAFEAMANAKR